MRTYEEELIIVTGGAGFIGSCIVRYLNNKGLHNIVIVDDLGKTEKWRNLVGKHYIDVISKHHIFDWLKGRESLVEAFIHLGACSDTMETNASYLLENNFQFTRRLAEYALHNNQRFIYASSAATYGDGTKGFEDKEASIYELEPLNMYGFSKQMFDQWALDEGVLDKLVGLKYFNVFGPNEAHKGRMASAITKMVPRILKGEKIQLFKSSYPDQFADGEQKRDFLYVKDAVRMTCAFLENDVGGIYNVGSAVADSWNDLARAVYKAMDKPFQIEYIDMPPELVAKYQNYSRADMTKTKKVLGNKITCMPLEDSVSDYVRNYIIPDKRW